MKKEIVMEKYPVFTMEIDKAECRLDSVDAIIAELKAKVEADPIAAFIAVFDHYSHTKGLADGEVSPAIKDAKNIVFCFGPKLPDPKMMAVRPRSIGIAETESGFTLTFLEAPMPPINDKMEAWVKDLIKKDA
jgi:hypothetical protein